MVRPLAPEITSRHSAPRPRTQNFSIRILSADSECRFSLRALHMRDCFSLLPPLPLASTVRGAAASTAEKSGSSRWPPRSPRRCGSNLSKCIVRVVGAGPPGHRAGDGGDLRDGRESSGLTGDSQSLPFRAPSVVRREAWEPPRLCCRWGRGCWGAGSAACCASLPREAAARAASTGPVSVVAAAALRSRLPALLPGGPWSSGLNPRRSPHGGSKRDPRGSGNRQAKPHFPNAYTILVILLMVKAETGVLGSHF